MKIAVVADKKSGHLTQCLGLRDVIQDYDHEKDVLFLGKDFISLPGFAWISLWHRDLPQQEVLKTTALMRGDSRRNLFDQQIANFVNAFFVLRKC